MDAFSEYTKQFVQRIPKYIVKTKGGTWKTKHKPLSDKAVSAHLEKKYQVGTISPWYPSYSILDFDSFIIKDVEDIRAELGLTDSNSMLLASESPNSYHLLMQPRYNGNPPTARLLKSSLDTFGKVHRVEIYPQANRGVRLPFGEFSKCMDERCYYLNSWEEKLYWFLKMNEVDLAIVPYQQMPIDLSTQENSHNELFLSKKLPDSNLRAQELLEHGLQAPSTRHDSQFWVLLFFFRCNMVQSQAESETWKWIQKKHNGFSETILRNPKEVRDEIRRQANSIWGRYELIHFFPDSTHNLHNGYICKPDIEEIIRYSGGNMPRAKFLFNLLKHIYPRRFQTFIGIHRDKLISWASHDTYLPYIRELESKGVIKRGTAYRQDVFSKDLKLNWHYRSSNEAILFSGRSLDTLESTLAFVYEPRELRELLITSSASKQAAYYTLTRIYG